MRPHDSHSVSAPAAFGDTEVGSVMWQPWHTRSRGRAADQLVVALDRMVAGTEYQEHELDRRIVVRLPVDSAPRSAEHDPGLEHHDRARVRDRDPLADRGRAQTLAQTQELVQQ